MNISKTIDKTVTSLEKVDWKQVTKEAIDLWVIFFKVIVALAIITYFAGEALDQGVHSLNDWIARHWVHLIVPPPPAEAGQAPIIEEVSGTAVEVEPMLTLVLEPMKILFTTPPLMLAEAQAPVALLAPAVVVQEQPPPLPRRRRRQSEPPAVAVTEPATTPTQRPRGRRAHQERKKNRQAA